MLFRPRSTSTPPAPSTTDLATTFETKKELKEGYNMKPASPIGKEWYEQIAALEEYATGKTAAEFLATATKAKDEHHTAVPDVEDLASTCTHGHR